jgi:hypothetical protein
LFTQKVVFVIGAGASYEYGLPLGSELKERIAKAVRFRFEYGHRLVGGDENLLDHIRRHAHGDGARSNEYTKAANLLANAIPAFVSVDEALHYVSGSVEAIEVGKIAIIDQILAAERKSKLAFDQNTGRIRSLPDGWLAEMLSIAAAGLRRSELATIFDHVTFVNFNYDRVIEQYLYWALQENLSATAEQAAHIVSNLNMLRPYGSIGKFSQNFNDQLGFGSTAYSDPFARLESLGTYTDQRPMHDLAEMDNALHVAKLIIFLGFGYHTSNVDLIKRPPGGGGLTVMGTVTGIHQSNLDVIRSRVARNLAMHVEEVTPYDLKAGELLQRLRPKILMHVS